MRRIPYGRQHIRDADIKAVQEVLCSDWLTQGPTVPQFEKAVATRCEARNAIAVNSATSALHVACMALGLGKGDWLWTTPITFVASANCGLYCGANVDFVDIDSVSYNMCPNALSTKLSQAEAVGKLPKIVVPVHLAGQPCNMSAIRKLSKKFGFKVVEDASHAIGSTYQKQPVGNCQHSDATIFSFHPVKIITTAEGGMVLTNDSEVAERARRLRTHGITRDPRRMSRVPDGPWYFEQIELGFNYRMTDIQAALGLSQLHQLDEFLARRRALARRYDSLLADLPIQLPQQNTDGRSAWHLYIVRLKSEKTQVTHVQVFKRLREQGIGVGLHYIPVHLHPYYQDLGFGIGGFPASEEYYREAISLPIFPDLSDEDQEYVYRSLRNALTI